MAQLEGGDCYDQGDVGYGEGVAAGVFGVFQERVEDFEDVSGVFQIFRVNFVLAEEENWVLELNGSVAD